MAITDQPTIDGFTTFLRGTVGIDPLNLPDNAPVIADAFAVACAWVALPLAPLPIYALAVYNFGADYVINYAPDQPGRTFFKDTLIGYNISLFTPGVIASSSDDGTAQSRLNPEFMKHLTLGDLQQLKTPYGRAYINIAQQYGASIWGIS